MSHHKQRVSQKCPKLALELMGQEVVPLLFGTCTSKITQYFGSH